MRISIKQRGTSWPWALVKFIFFGLVARVPLNVSAALGLFAAYRTSEQYSTLDPLEFQQWKAPAEDIFTWTLWFFWWYYQFSNRFEVSFHSGQGQAFERNNTAHGGWDGPRSNTATRLAYATHSEQDQLVERKSTEHIESDKPTSNSAARLTQPLGLDFENMEGGPEPTIEDSRHSPSSRTPLPIDGTHQHRQILHRNIPSSHRPDGEQQRREISQGQSHSHLTNSVQRHDISSTSLSVQANNLPNPKYQVTVEEEATSDDDETTSMYTAEGGEKAVVAYTAQIGKEKVSSSHMHMEVQMTAEDCEKKAALTSTAQNGKGTASSSHTHMPVRLTLKNRLLEEAIEDWKANNGIDELKELVYYDDDNDFDYIPNLNALISERKRYEHYCNDTTVRISRPFHVYGTEELHEHNRLRL